MKFSYSAVWEDTVRLIKAHASLLLAIAGVFIFLPTVLTSYFLPQPEAATPDLIFPIMMTHFRETWHWTLLASLFTMVGTIAMYLLIFARGTLTVGSALSEALRIMPYYIAAFLVVAIVITVAAMLLLVPATMLLGPAALLIAIAAFVLLLWVAGRLMVLGPVLVAERKGPIAAITRTLELTRGRGWRIIGLILLIGIAGAIVIGVATMAIGMVLILAAGQDLGEFLLILVSSALGAVFSTVLLVLMAALYRAFVPGDLLAETFD